MKLLTDVIGPMVMGLSIAVLLKWVDRYYARKDRERQGVRNLD
jgi:hypothetical protein